MCPARVEDLLAGLLVQQDQVSFPEAQERRLLSSWGRKRHFVNLFHTGFISFQAERASLLRTHWGWGCPAERPQTLTSSSDPPGRSPPGPVCPLRCWRWRCTRLLWWSLKWNSDPATFLPWKNKICTDQLRCPGWRWNLHLSLGSTLYAETLNPSFLTHGPPIRESCHWSGDYR